MEPEKRKWFQKAQVLTLIAEPPVSIHWFSSIIVILVMTVCLFIH